MESMNRRIEQLIDYLGIRKNAFAERLNISQAFVSQLCSGSSKPSDRTIADICREFNVNEAWLRTGEGEMFRPKSKNTLLLELFNDAMEEESGTKRKLLSVMARLTGDQWKLLADMAHTLAEEEEKEEAGQD